ncbi:MAG: T9SS type A sorting domain-containing protein, partial [bacterium]
YPNPFNPITKIKYTLPNESEVKISIYNTLGEKVTELINKTQPAGFYEMEWNASNFSSGVYIYQLEAKSQNTAELFHDVKKMILLR